MTVYGVLRDRDGNIVGVGNQEVLMLKVDQIHRKFPHLEPLSLIIDRRLADREAPHTPTVSP